MTSPSNEIYTKEEAIDWLRKRVSLLEKGEEFSLVAEYDGKVVARSRLGFMGKPSSHVGFVEIEVRKAYRNIGIGTEMLRTSVDQARKRGLRLLVLGVYSTNNVALHVYEKIGFKRVGLIPKFFFNDGDYVDEVVMAMEI